MRKAIKSNKKQTQKSKTTRETPDIPKQTPGNECFPINVVYSYRVAQKSQPQTFVHIFAKYWPIFKSFHWRILWKICNKVVTKHYQHTLTLSLHYLVKYKICKIHQYFVKIGTRVWSLIFGPSCTSIVFSCLQTPKVYLQEAKLSLG